jgi:hypothetical protein
MRLKLTAEQELLLREWQEYTTGANVHNMNRWAQAFRLAAGATGWGEQFANPEQAERWEKQMRTHLSQLKLAKLNGTFYRVP